MAEEIEKADNTTVANDGDKSNFNPLSFDQPEVTTGVGGFVDRSKEFKPVGEPSVVIDDAEEAKQHRGKHSSKGELFDPVLHKYPPQETTGGKWKRIPKAERDAKKTNTSSGEPEIINSDFITAGREWAQAYGHAHVIIYGDGGEIQNEKDLDPLAASLASALMKHNVSSRPDPVLASLMNAISYSKKVNDREINKGKLKYLFVSSRVRLKALFRINQSEQDVEYLNKLAGVVIESAPEKTDPPPEIPSDSRKADVRDDGGLEAMRNLK